MIIPLVFPFEAGKTVSIRIQDVTDPSSPVVSRAYSSTDVVEVPVDLTDSKYYLYYDFTDDKLYQVDAYDSDGNQSAGMVIDRTVGGVLRLGDTQVIANALNLAPEGVAATGSVYDLLNASLTGSSHVTLTFLKTDTTTPLEGVKITVRNPGDTANKGVVTTDADGQVSFDIDDAVYHLRAVVPGYLFDTLTLTVSGDTTETYYGAVVDVGSPESADSIRVYEYIALMDDDTIPAQATIQATAQIAVLPYDYNGKLHAGTLVDATFDATYATTGLIYWDVVRGAQVIFKITTVTPTAGIRKTIPLTGDSVRMTDIP